MTQNLFKRAAIFTDIHFGKKNNDRQYNMDCENFVKWFINQAKSAGADAIIFCGDWFDNRHSIHISTLNYGLSSYEMLDKCGIPVYMIPGNHDLFYKEKRELSSVAIGRNFKNIKFLNDVTQIGNVVFFPWLVHDEWKQVQKKVKGMAYAFGHFELPNFMMNAMVEMADHGQLNSSHFEDLEYMAFSGHFHKRQVKGKVCYVGSPFAQTYADAWDDERGMILLDWGKTPQFINWQDGPRYRTLNLSDLLEDPFNQISSNSFCKVVSDLDISYDEIQFIKDIFVKHYTPRKLDFIPGSKRTDDFEFNDDEVKFQSVDQIVLEGIKNIDSLTIDAKILSEIYMSLK